MHSIHAVHSRQRGRFWILLSSPVIYGMIIPLVMIDLCISLYQNVCFPVYGIATVPRKKYVQLVRRGLHLPWLDRFNCTYCSYANGVCAYLRAVLIETEKYWCPIKYKARAGYIPPHPQGTYAPDGDLKTLETVLKNGPPAPQGKA